jgi:hypothetical protein
MSFDTNFLVNKLNRGESSISYKLASSLLFCFEQAEARQHSLERMMEQATMSSSSPRPPLLRAKSRPYTSLCDHRNPSYFAT